jgi:hypothetical protein
MVDQKASMTVVSMAEHWAGKWVGMKAVLRVSQLVAK